MDRFVSAARSSIETAELILDGKGYSDCVVLLRVARKMLESPSRAIQDHYEAGETGRAVVSSQAASSPEPVSPPSSQELTEDEFRRIMKGVVSKANSSSGARQKPQYTTAPANTECTVCNAEYHTHPQDRNVSANGSNPYIVCCEDLPVYLI